MEYRNVCLQPWQKNRRFLGMAIFDNMCVPALKICLLVWQLLVSRNDTEHKVDNSFDVRFIKSFDADN